MSAMQYFILMVSMIFITVDTIHSIKDTRLARRTERQKVRARLLGMMVERMKHDGPYR